MNITEWFDIKNRKHIEAWIHLRATGQWPINFIPIGMEFSNTWQMELAFKMATAYCIYMSPGLSNALEDLQKRSLEIVAMICKTKDNKIQLLCYNEKGLVSFISEKIDDMEIYQKLKDNTIRYICTLSIKE